MDVENEHNNEKSFLDLGNFALGCVQEVLVSAPAKLKAGKYPIKIFVEDPDDSMETVNPHAIVNLTVVRADEDEAVEAPKERKNKIQDVSNSAAGGSAIKKQKVQDDASGKVSTMPDQQQRSYASVLEKMSGGFNARTRHAKTYAQVMSRRARQCPP